MSDDDAPDKDRPPRGLEKAPDQRAAAEQQLESLTAPTAACGSQFDLPERPWPQRRSDFEQPASSWVALVVAFDGGDPEEISALIRLAKSSPWTWKALDKSAGATVPSTQVYLDTDSASSNDPVMDHAEFPKLYSGSPYCDEGE